MEHKSLDFGHMKFWNEEKNCDAIYDVYLKKVRYKADLILNDRSDAALNFNQLQWETVKIKRLKAGTIDKIIENLFEKNHIYHNNNQELNDNEDYLSVDEETFRTFLSTYRTYMTPFELVCKLKEKYVCDLKNQQEAKFDIHREMSRFMKLWLREFPEDYYQNCEDETFVQKLTKLLKLINDERVTSLFRLLRTRDSYRNFLLKRIPYYVALIAEVNSKVSNPPLEGYNAAGYDEKRYSSLDDISIDRIAQQITLMDKILLGSLIPYECLGTHWNNNKKFDRTSNGNKSSDTKKGPPKPRITCLSVMATVDFFNLVSFRVMDTLLSTSCYLAKYDANQAQLSVSCQSRRLKKWIKIAQAFSRAKNYSSLKAVVSALHSNPIHLLTNAWKGLSKDILNIYEELEKICSEENNYSKLRSDMIGGEIPSHCHLSKRDNSTGTGVDVTNFKSSSHVQRYIRSNTEASYLTSSNHSTPLQPLSSSRRGPNKKGAKTFVGSKSSPNQNEYLSPATIVPYLGVYLTDLTMLHTIIPDNVIPTPDILGDGEEEGEEEGVLINKTLCQNNRLINYDKKYREYEVLSILNDHVNSVHRVFPALKNFRGNNYKATILEVNELDSEFWKWFAEPACGHFSFFCKFYLEIILGSGYEATHPHFSYPVDLNNNENDVLSRGLKRMDMNNILARPTELEVSNLLRERQKRLLDFEKLAYKRCTDSHEQTCKDTLYSSPSSTSSSKLNLLNTPSGENWDSGHDKKTPTTTSSTSRISSGGKSIKNWFHFNKPGGGTSRSRDMCEGQESNYIDDVANVGRPNNRNSKSLTHLNSTNNFCVPDPCNFTCKTRCQEGYLSSLSDGCPFTNKSLIRSATTDFQYEKVVTNNTIINKLFSPILPSNFQRSKKRFKSPFAKNYSYICQKLSEPYRKELRPASKDYMQPYKFSYPRDDDTLKGTTGLPSWKRPQLSYHQHTSNGKKPYNQRFAASDNSSNLISVNGSSSTINYNLTQSFDDSGVESLTNFEGPQLDDYEFPPSLNFEQTSINRNNEPLLTVTNHSQLENHLSDAKLVKIFLEVGENEDNENGNEIAKKFTYVSVNRGECVSDTINKALPYLIVESGNRLQKCLKKSKYDIYCYNNKLQSTQLSSKKASLEKLSPTTDLYDFLQLRRKEGMKPRFIIKRSTSSFRKKKFEDDLSKI